MSILNLQNWDINKTILHEMLALKLENVSSRFWLSCRDIFSFFKGPQNIADIVLRGTLALCDIFTYTKNR